MIVSTAVAERQRTVVHDEVRRSGSRCWGLARVVVRDGPDHLLVLGKRVRAGQAQHTGRCGVAWPRSTCRLWSRPTTRQRCHRRSGRKRDRCGRQVRAVVRDDRAGAMAVGPASSVKVAVVLIPTAPPFRSMTGAALATMRTWLSRRVWPALHAPAAALSQSLTVHVPPVARGERVIRCEWRGAGLSVNVPLQHIRVVRPLNSKRRRRHRLPPRLLIVARAHNGGAEAERRSRSRAGDSRMLKTPY